MKELKISKQISLPVNAVTQTMAMIGRKGAGKTYLATMIAEQMLDNKAQVVIIDPVGVWWGLRVDADGKRKGKEIFVIGGDHGDIPLVPEAGRKIAKLLVEKSISVVLDVSSFRIGEHKRFAADFAEEFFHLKKSHRSPVHVFVEEAQKLIPQRVGADEARMVGAFEQIVRLGRNYGIGCSLVTQRPQSVNKEVLSQVECLCVLQVTGPHERKALEEWVQEVGADRTLIGELPGLAQGEGYVWSPSWLRLFKRVNFSKKQTFDASATPEVGKQTQAASISAVDVEELREQMKEVVEQAEKDNPAVLRRKIAELEKQGAGKKVVHDMTVPTKMIEDAVKKAVAKRDSEWKYYVREVTSFLQSIRRNFDATGNWLEKLEKFKAPEASEFVIAPSKPFIAVDTGRGKDKSVAVVAQRKAGGQVEIISSFEVGEQKFGLCEKKIYSFLAENPGREFSKTQVAAVTGYSLKSGGYINALSKLNAAGIIRKSGDKISLATDAPELYLEGEEFSAEPRFWSSKLGACENKIYQYLWDRKDEIVLKDEIAEATGYSATSGGFINSISKLNALGLIRRVDGGLTINDELLNI